MQSQSVIIFPRLTWRRLRARGLPATVFLWHSRLARNLKGRAARLFDFKTPVRDQTVSGSRHTFSKSPLLWIRILAKGTISAGVSSTTGYDFWFLMNALTQLKIAWILRVKYTNGQLVWDCHHLCVKKNDIISWAKGWNGKCVTWHCQCLRGGQMAIFWT